MSWKVVDLIPVLKPGLLGGKVPISLSRKPISIQYPLVELITAGLFAASYILVAVLCRAPLSLLRVWTVVGVVG